MEWGLGDFWNLRTELSGEGGFNEETSGAGGASVGVQVSTLIDATSWIPYLAAGMRGSLVGTFSGGGVQPCAEVWGGVGLDYRPRRHWALGVMGSGGALWASEPGFGATWSVVTSFKMFLPYFFE